MPAAPQPLIPGLEQNRAQVVVVRSTGVLELTEHAALHHLEDEQLIVPVVAVLHHQAVSPRALGRVDELRAILERVGGRNLGGGVLPRFHRRQHHGHVEFPRRGRVHEVDVVASHEVAIRLGTVGKACRLVVMPGLPHLLHRELHLLGHGVTERGDSHVRHAHPLAQHRPSAEARPDDRDAYGLPWLERDTGHRRRVRRKPGEAVDGRAASCSFCGIGGGGIGTENDPRRCDGGALEKVSARGVSSHVVK